MFTINNKITQKSRAFTLLEMLLVIAIIAILAGIVIIAINPARQLAQARNAQRSSDLRALHSAVNQYYIENREWPSNLSTVTTLTEICNTGTGTTTHSVNCGTLVDLSSLVPTYIPAIPTDPQVTASLPFTNTAHAQTTNGTGYEIALDSTTQMVMLTAPNSDEYGLTPVQLGTTALTTESWACGDLLSYEGQDYATVEIGTQCWMQENLNIGTRIAGTSNQTNNDTIEKYCYNNDEGICDTDGGLYQWGEMMQYSYTLPAQGICPTGWHIPTHDEFTDLERAICTSGTCATDFPYDTTTTGWRGTDEGSKLSNLTSGGTNESGFTGLLAGVRSAVGSFGSRGTSTLFWSSVEDGSDAWRRSLYSSYAQVPRSTSAKEYGFSVRCLKN